MVFTTIIYYRLHLKNWKPFCAFKHWTLIMFARKNWTQRWNAANLKRACSGKNDRWITFHFSIIFGSNFFRSKLKLWISAERTYRRIFFFELIYFTLIWNIWLYETWKNIFSHTDILKFNQIHLILSYFLSEFWVKFIRSFGSQVHNHLFM